MVQDFDVLSFGDSFNHLPHDDAASSSAGPKIWISSSYGINGVRTQGLSVFCTPFWSFSYFKMK